MESLKAVLGDNAYDYEKPSPVRTFLTKQIKDLYPVFGIKARRLLAGLEAEIREVGADGSVGFGEWATRVTVDIIGLAGMGRDFKALQNSNDILVQNYNSLLEPTRSNAIYFTSNLVFPPWFIRALPWKKTLELDRITGSLRSYCLDLVHERQDEIKSDRAIDKMDILTLLIKSNDFKDTELADQMLTFLAAG
ncbi:MAG: hypothetical protein LQ340_007630, partial [Diploschistes diacapsis]